MALPKLNSTPSHTTKIPSTGQTITYRPYLVKEEKVLMIAFETGDQKQALGAVVDTLDACISEEIDTKRLTTFDIEYLFTQIRSKSVVEVATVMLGCSSCQHKNETSIVLSEIEVDMPSVSNVIELTPSISVEMQYPTYTSIIEMDFEGNETQVGFDMLSKCIGAILTEEERIDTKDVSSKEVSDFIEQMTTDQFKNVSQFLQEMPSLKKDVEFVCDKCGENNTTTLKGINDFLS
jgi:DNA-directed RNA polymerase subunit M/transcription elongation factor TFIIS